MARSVEEILDDIAVLSVMDVVKLVELMEDKFGVSAAAVAAAPVAAAAPAAAEEKTEFDIVLTNIGDKKVNVIKVVRAVTGLAIKEAKDAVENVPSTLKEAVSKEDAEAIKKQFEEAGAKIEIK